MTGVNLVGMDPAIATQPGVPPNTPGGAMAQRVGAATPATAGGLQQTDIVSAINGQPVTTGTAFAQALNRHQPGDQLSLAIVPTGQHQTVQAALAEHPQ